MNKAYWTTVEHQEFEKVATYFEKATLDNSDTFKFPQSPRKTIEELLDKGKIIVAKNNEQIIGLLGYFKGVPRIEKNKVVCEEQHLAHIYCFVIDKEYRGSLAFAVKEIVAKEAIKDDCNLISFRAERDNISLNEAYSRIATKVNEEKSTLGTWSNRYIANPNDWIRT